MAELEVDEQVTEPEQVEGAPANDAPARVDIEAMVEARVREALAKAGRSNDGTAPPAPNESELTALVRRLVDESGRERDQASRLDTMQKAIDEMVDQVTAAPRRGWGWLIVGG